MIKTASSSLRATSSSAQGYGGQIERAPLSLEKLSIQDDIVTYTTKEGVAHEFDALEFLALLSTQVPKPYESLTRYYGRSSCRRRGERAKLAPLDQAETIETYYRRGFTKSTWAACIKRIFRKKLYRSIEEPQVDLDAWLVRYNTERMNQGKHCKGRTPMQTFLEDRCLANEKDLSRLTVTLAA